MGQVALKIPVPEFKFGRQSCKQLEFNKKHQRCNGWHGHYSRQATHALQNPMAMPYGKSITIHL